MDRHGPTTNDVIAELCRDPEFAARWAESEPQVDLGINVSRIREERGMTQQQLADAAGLKQPRIAEIERTNANPTLLTLTRIANALGVRIERLFADTSVRGDAEAPRVPQEEGAGVDEKPITPGPRKRKASGRRPLAA